MKKTFVLDTCVFLSDPSCLKHFDNNDIIIPLKVLDEIDKNKARQDGAGFNARYVIRVLDVYRTKGSLFGKLVRLVGEPLCAVLGTVIRPFAGSKYDAMLKGYKN